MAEPIAFQCHFDLFLTGFLFPIIWVAIKLKEANIKVRILVLLHGINIILKKCKSLYKLLWGRVKYYSFFFCYVYYLCFSLAIIFNADYAQYRWSFSLMVVANP